MAANNGQIGGPILGDSIHDVGRMADVDELENVYLYNIDHLESIVRENSRMREQELSKCNEIITGRATALIARLYPAGIRTLVGVALSGFATEGSLPSPAP